MLRRDMLKAMCAGAAMAPLMAPSEAFATYRPGDPQIPSLIWLRRGKDEYRGDYAGAAGFREVCWLLRDAKANVVGIPDWRLLRLLSWEQAWLLSYGYDLPFEVHSGLRMPATNAGIEDAAKASCHLPDANLVFKAIDYSTRLISGEYLGRLASLAQAGGVGFYGGADFTHNDVGKVRHWRRR